jgi:hypothetical protein
MKHKILMVAGLFASVIAYMLMAMASLIAPFTRETK